MSGNRIAGLALGLFGLIGLTGCSDGTEPELYDFRIQADRLTATGIGDLLMITQDLTPSEYPEALFQGVVAADHAGCLTLQYPEGDQRVTALWPEGYELRDASTSPRIVNAAGETVGTLGGDFEFGGGQVNELPEALGFTDADRELADERCPGLYWIVALSEV